jgi:glucuronate isomerase
MAFLDNDFLLTSELAMQIYHQYAASMPIVDYHSHLDPQDILDDRQYDNLTQIWINDGTKGDHYKWRLMRTAGVDEKYITGHGDDHQKFLHWVKTLQNAIGNPIYEWSHLELKRYFGIDKLITPENAEYIWNTANEMLKKPEFSVRNIMRRSNVKIAVTTDDPADSLDIHQRLHEIADDLGFQVLPSFRPGAIFEINNYIHFSKYIEKLQNKAGKTINDFEELIEVFYSIIDEFNDIGGHIADFGFDTFKYFDIDDAQANKIFIKAISSQSLSHSEVAGFQTRLIERLLEKFNQLDWVVQLHLNVVRNINSLRYHELGNNTGFDAIGIQNDMVGHIIQFMNKIREDNFLPKMIIYSLNPNDWMPLATILNSFQDTNNGSPKIQLGAAWWFNDNRDGMEKQLRIWANQGLIGYFTGMLTDSRSFLSYPRHEYFRRVMSNFLANLAIDGLAPDDPNILGEIAKRISYQNAIDYFRFEERK